MNQPIIQFNRISKSFAGATALSDVSLSIAPAECHALMGENGAGKSTLGKILAGIHRPDGGQILLGGKPVDFRSPADAIRAGVAMVHQELAFCPDLSVAENLCMGQYPRRLGLLDRRAMRNRADELLSRIGVNLDARTQMSALSTAEEQLVQIAAAVGTDARILIFDEPTSSLSEPEAIRLFSLIEELRRQGKTMIYVSHRMPEVFRLCDSISILRDGKFVATLSRAEATPDRVVQMMIGRSVEEYLPRHQAAPGAATVLEVKDLSSPGKFGGISFDVRAGEIVGFAGLVGAGRSEVAKAIFGLDSTARGTVRIEGEAIPLGQIRQAMRLGIALVPEDRKRQGLVLKMAGRSNISLAMLRRLSRYRLLKFRAEQALAREMYERLRVRASSIESPVDSLSGGNQQKIALAKWLARNARVLIVDEPTRGVDIGAKTAIHQILDELAQTGIAIILISSELPEVIRLSTRILVMRDGRIVEEIPRADATQERVMRAMAGVN